MPLVSYEFPKIRFSESFTCLRATGVLPIFSLYFVCFAYNTVQKMNTSLYQVSEQGFHENRHKVSHTLLTVVIEIRRPCTMKANDVYKTKNASVKSVCRHGIHYFQYSCQYPPYVSMNNE